MASKIIDLVKEGIKDTYSKQEQEARKAIDMMDAAARAEPSSPELPPTQPTDLSPPQAPVRNRPSGARVAHTLKRSLGFNDLEAMEMPEQELSSDPGVHQDTNFDDVMDLEDEEHEYDGHGLTGGEDDWEVEAPDFLEYMTQPRFGQVPAESMMALLKSAVRYLEDRMELERVRKGLPTKNSSRRGMSYKKAKGKK